MPHRRHFPLTKLAGRSSKEILACCPTLDTPSMTGSMCLVVRPSVGPR
jgi:hypothetical protein